jgi:glycosyltransferase involved in cell wall biosynthesis
MDVLRISYLPEADAFRAQVARVTDRTIMRSEGGRRLRAGARAKGPLVSIISVAFRAREELPALLESIIAVRDDRTELIVIDGGSNDGSVEVLRGFGESIDYWVSEPDGGIYDAMNKGIAAATGQFVLHLNAGDRLRCIPWQELEQALADNIDVACFAVKIEGCRTYRPRTGFFLRFANTWHHQGTFYRRKTHLGYRTQYRIFGDFDLNQRMMKAGKSVRLSNTVVAEVIGAGVSADMSNYREQYSVVKQNFGTPYVCLALIWRCVWPAIVAVKRWARR